MVNHILSSQGGCGTDVPPPLREVTVKDQQTSRQASKQTADKYNDKNKVKKKDKDNGKTKYQKSKCYMNKYIILCFRGESPMMT